MTPEVLALTHAAAFAPERGWSKDEFADLLEDPNTILAIDGPTFLLARVAADEAEILTLASPPETQRRGHASRALGAFHQMIKSRGVTRVFLEVAKDNQAARALYSGAGYSEVGGRRGYYRRSNGTTIDAIVLALELGAAPA